MTGMRRLPGILPGTCASTLGPSTACSCSGPPIRRSRGVACTKLQSLRRPRSLRSAKGTLSAPFPLHCSRFSTAPTLAARLVADGGSTSSGSGMIHTPPIFIAPTTRPCCRRVRSRLALTPWFAAASSVDRKKDISAPPSAPAMVHPIAVYMLVPGDRKFPEFNRTPSSSREVEPLIFA